MEIVVWVVVIGLLGIGWVKVLRRLGRIAGLTPGVLGRAGRRTGLEPALPASAADDDWPFDDEFGCLGTDSTIDWDHGVSSFDDWEPPFGFQDDCGCGGGCCDDGWCHGCGCEGSSFDDPW